MTKLKKVLYAEDDENDGFFMERAFAALGIKHLLEIVPDGKAVMAFLSGAPPYADREKPTLVLMDLSMPGRHGLDVLKWMKNQPSLADLPVIIFTSSNQESDISRAYQLGADGYIVKPGRPNELLAVMKMVHDYWLAEPRPNGTFVDFASAVNVPPPKPVT